MFLRRWISRPWFRNGYVSYKGKKYKIAGRACMDQFMVDFKETNPKEGDSVLIFGRIGPDHIPIEQIAKEINTTTYALLTYSRKNKIPCKIIILINGILEE